jgi:hypothetical protein
VEIYLDGVQQQLCANAACSSNASRVTGRTIHPDATIYRLHTGMYYNDITDATRHKHPVIYLDDWMAYANDPRPGSPRPEPTSAPEPTPSPSRSEPTPKYNRDSETGDLSHWEGLHQDTLNRAPEVTSPHIHGSYARALEVREGT